MREIRGAAGALKLCGALLASILLVSAGAGAAPETASTFDLQSALLHDPASPVAGNPNGDITIVAFTDYNCPYCRRSDGDLNALIAADPKIRVVYKDWPRLAKSSVTAAKVAIAAGLQGKYSDVHNALMRMTAHPATDESISKAVVASGADVAQLNRDLDKRDGEIVTLLKRNFAEAEALKLDGTPVFIIGPYVQRGALDMAGFRQAVADARKAKEQPATR